MKLTLDLPDWVDERMIRIFAGIEEVAKRPPQTRVWEIKSQRCNWCGSCCKNVPVDWPQGQNIVTGHCRHLIQNKTTCECDLLADRPFMCCAGEGIEGECNITWQNIANID